jgi:hypothetical protein
MGTRLSPPRRLSAKIVLGRRSTVVRATVALAALALLVSCTSSGENTPSPGPSTPISSQSSSGLRTCVTSSAADQDVAAPRVEGAPLGAVLPKVTGRCNEQVDMDGPGINFSGSASFGLNGGKVEIPAANWYTIGSTTEVPANVTVIVDPVIHQTPTSQRRFQYLADLIELIPQPTFCPSGLLVVRSPGSYVEIGVIRNSGFATLHLRGLHVTLTETPPRHVVGDKVLFPAPPGMTLAANSMYFFETVFAANGVPDSSPKTDSFNFHWDMLQPPGTAHCG